VSDDLRAALAALSPRARDRFRHALGRPAERGSTSHLILFGSSGDGDYLLDDLVYAINRGTLDPDERESLVEMLNEIAMGRLAS